MSTMRKIIIPLLLFIYLIGSGIIPPVPNKHKSNIQFPLYIDPIQVLLFLKFQAHI